MKEKRVLKFGGSSLADARRVVDVGRIVSAAARTVESNMYGTPGISGRLFSALGAQGINVYAIAQGSSERSISSVIQHKHKQDALGTIHRAFLDERGVSERG